jgi:hypothetical protein
MDANVGFREKEQSLPGLVPPDSVILLVVSTLLTRLADSWVKLMPLLASRDRCLDLIWGYVYNAGIPVPDELSCSMYNC